MLIDLEKAKELGIFPVNVFVNGVPVNNCISFDTERGFAKYHRIDTNDQVVLCDYDSEKIAEGVLYGVVTYSKVER